MDDDNGDPRHQNYDDNQDQMDSHLYNNDLKEEDKTYKNEELKGLGKVNGPQPAKPMPHKTTRAFSPLELNEWYEISVQNPAGDEIYDADKKTGLDQWIKEIRTGPSAHISSKAAYKSSPYIGPLYRGGQDEFRYNARLNQPSDAGWNDSGKGQDDSPGANGGSSVRTCKSMIAPGMGVDNPVYSPEWMRLEMDNCANQYILRQNSRFSDMVYETQSPRNGLSAESCQPLKTVSVDEEDQEYAADWYYAIAWDKLLNDPNFLARNGLAPKEPNYGTGGEDAHNIKISDPIPVPNGFGHTELSDLTAKGLQVERIMDPSHPFSPRWDYEFNDRDFYSPFTVFYGGNPRNAVRCAGDRNKEIKVDIMEFRAARFRAYIMSRIMFNIACYNNYYCRIYVWEPADCSADEPCCATRWDQDDKIPTEICNSIAGALYDDQDMSAKDLCSWLAKPVVPVNVLKMRKNEKANFPNGVPEGYAFKEYFGNHKPYMRCWDTGQECGLKEKGDYADDAKNEEGSKYAIMGAGREGQNCAIGGSLGRLGVPNPSDITSWSELKLYQVGAIRRGVYCLPRNDILYKTGGDEDFVLYSAGAAPQLSVKDTTGANTRFRTTPWPLGWRGYVLDPGGNRFPNFGGGGITGTGLSGAKPGDIVVYDSDVVMSGAPRGESEDAGDDTWRLPYVGIVEGGDNAYARAGGDGDGPESIKIIAHNHGKYPDACGNSQTDLGMGEVFTAYKGEFPAWLDARFGRVGKITKSCGDPSLSSCIEPKWDDVKLYSPHN